MIKGVLDVMVGLVESGMTMLCVAHEIDFDETVADWIFFIDADQIIKDNEREEFFKNPQNELTQLFLSQILEH